MIDDPWKEMPASARADNISAKRVDPSLKYAFFWGKDTDGHCLLLLQHTIGIGGRSRWPKLQGIDVFGYRHDGTDQQVLGLRLLDHRHRDLFHRLCMDIVESAGGASSETEATSQMIARTWRWHHLLRGGRDERLSSEEQKGLLGELIVFRRLLKQLPAHDVVNAWRGPLGAPKDFEVGRRAIESKARRGAGTPYIAISSEHQLDDTGTDGLLLYVSEIDTAPSDRTEGVVNLAALAREVADAIAAGGAEASAKFDTLLTAAGFRWSDDYADCKWLIGGAAIYAVAEGFPRITPGCFSPGVLNVRYSVNLPSCQGQIQPGDAFEAFIEGALHG